MWRSLGADGYDGHSRIGGATATTCSPATIALNHLSSMGKVFAQTGTVWENYAPDALAPGNPAKGDFVGWSGTRLRLSFSSNSRSA